MGIDEVLDEVWIVCVCGVCLGVCRVRIGRTIVSIAGSKDVGHPLLARWQLDVAGAVANK